MDSILGKILLEHSIKKTHWKKTEVYFSFVGNSVKKNNQEKV